MEFTVSIQLTSVDDKEMLAALRWMKDNHSGVINVAQAIGSSKRITVDFVYGTFDEAVDMITVLKTQFDTRLIEYDLTMN